MIPHIREATEADLPRVIELIHRGAVDGRSAENLGPPLPDSYRVAFYAIQHSPHCRLFVAELDGEVVGTFQFVSVPNISHGGRPVAEVESVHVAESHRGHGIGQAMMEFAVEQARSLGCHRIQLTSNKARTDAHRFYRRLGFESTHEGFKLRLGEE